MASIGDSFHFILYRIVWAIVIILGIFGFFSFIKQSIAGQILASLINVIGANPATFVNNVVNPIGMTLLILLGIAIVVGFIEVIIVALAGEEIILFVSWITPFIFIGISLYLYYQSNWDYNYLGGALIGIILLILLIVFRHKLRLSARLIEKSAEIVAGNPTMMLPQFWAAILVIIANIMGYLGAFLVSSLSYNIHPYLAIVTGPLYYWVVTFTITGSKAFADAHNIAYVDEWYNKPSDPVFSHASKTVKELRGPIAKYAFLMAFVGMFKSRRTSRYSSRGLSIKSIGNLFRLDKLISLITSQGSVKNVVNRATDTAARAIEYIGMYTLVIIVTKKLKSVTEAYKESAKTIFQTFITTVGGSIGFRIIDALREWSSKLIFIIAGLIYGYLFPDIANLSNTSLIAKIIWAIIMAIVFYGIGFETVDIMFKPVTNTFRVLLYKSFTDVKSGKKLPNKIDEKTRELMIESFK